MARAEKNVEQFKISTTKVKRERIKLRRLNLD